MKITYITAYDGMGQNFNGYVLMKRLNNLGHQARMIVYEKLLNDPDVIEIDSPWLRKVNKSLSRFEQRLSLHSMLPVLSFPVMNSELYRNADIIHLQLLHARQFFSMLTLPLSTRRKKTIWTIHDPWITTGHCIYSMFCDRWLTGCGNCPDLAIPIEARNDRTALNWKLKKWSLDNSRLHLIVASKWMENWIKQSPILSRFPCSHIPFGIDLEVFKPANRTTSRAPFGIPPDANVLSFRSTPFGYDFKGTRYIEEALLQYQPKKPTYLITFDYQGGLNSIREKYKFLELGWVKDQKVIQQALSASDIFLMPSIAEAFGLMAIEAMACGLPVVVFDGTSLPEVIQGAECGKVVPYKDSTALADAIRTLLEDEELRMRLGENALRLAQNEYSIDLYTQRHLDLYHQVLQND